MGSSLDNKDIKVPYLQDLSHAQGKLNETGFTNSFKATEDGLLCLETEKKYQPDQLTIVNFFRFEGISDPDDNSILYAIETDDGTKGTLQDAYGAYADPLVDKIVRQIKRIEHE
jgi:hypothetical protein